MHLLHDHFGISNLQAALGSALAIWGFSLITIFSFTGAGWAQIDLVVLGRELPTLYHLLEHTAINILLPVSGLLIALFAGWILPATITRDELGRPPMAFHIWRLILRYIAPIALLTLFWQNSVIVNHLPLT